MAEIDFHMEVLNKWNAESFRLLYKYYYRSLVNFSMQIVVSKEEGEDIVQSVFASLLEKHCRFDNVNSLKAFLYNSVRNLSLDKLRHKDVEDHYVKLMEKRYGEFSDDDDSVYGEELYRLLFEYIDQLPPKSKSVFLLYIKGKTNQEIADMMGVSSETVKTHKKRCMSFLRKNLKQEDFLFVCALLVINQNVC